ncbi:MAG: SPOR domain-containing protein [Bacteroidales bacterium]|nr:SPOR domain-containing protein [Bacteroidales bacterium]
MIDSYIFDMLREKSRVIIPDFGAFLMKQEYQTEEHTTGKFVISFNDFLRFNDGLLVDFIADSEGVSKDTASHLLADFLKQLKTELKLNGSFELFQMGVLHQDAQGKISFVQTQDPAAVPYEDRLFKTKPKLFISEVTPLANPDLETDFQYDSPMPEDSTQAMEFSSLETSENPSLNSDLSSQETHKEPDLNEAMAFEETSHEPIHPTALNTSETNHAEPKHKAQTDEPNHRKESSEIEPVLKGDRTSVATIILIILLLLLASGAALYVGDFVQLPFQLPFVSDTSQTVSQSADDSSFFAMDPEESITETSFEEDTLFVDSLNTESDNLNSQSDSLNLADDETEFGEEEITAEEEPKPVQQPNVTQFPHYIIGFSIGPKAKAEKKVEELRARGFDAKIVNERNGLFRVAYQSYPDRESAIRGMKELKISENNPQAWYLFYEGE